MTLLTAMGLHGPVLHRTWPQGPLSALTVIASTAVAFSLVSLIAFRKFLTDIVQTHFPRRKAKLAAAIGINVRSLSRTMHPKEGKYTFNLEHCLKLAKALRPHVNARDVLQKADRTKQAQLIEELFGPRAAQRRGGDAAARFARPRCVDAGRRVPVCRGVG